MALVDYKGFRVRAQALSATEAQVRFVTLLRNYIF